MWTPDLATRKDLSVLKAEIERDFHKALYVHTGSIVATMVALLTLFHFVGR